MNPFHNLTLCVEKKMVALTLETELLVIPREIQQGLHVIYTSPSKTTQTGLNTHCAVKQYYILSG